MTLGQTDWLKGKITLVGKHKLVSDQRTANVYAQQVPNAASKAEALQKAAELNAIVGKTIDDNAYSKWEARKRNPVARTTWNPNWKWTKPEEPEKDLRIQKLDPFWYEARVPYTAGSESHRLSLTFQHATNWSGYVVQVQDTSNPGASTGASMYDLGAEPLKTGVVSSGARFSNVHERRSQANVLDTTGTSDEQGLDAYTKIAGEGARWQCVRRHAPHLTNQSYFFVRDSDGDAWGVQFNVLWLRWQDVFNKEYDISDEQVAAAMIGGSFGDDFKHVGEPDDRDYDLDEGCSYDPG